MVSKLHPCHNFQLCESLLDLVRETLIAVFGNAGSSTFVSYWSVKSIAVNEFQLAITVPFCQCKLSCLTYHRHFGLFLLKCCKLSVSNIVCYSSCSTLSDREPILFSNLGVYSSLFFRINFKDTCEPLTNGRTYNVTFWFIIYIYIFIIYIDKPVVIQFFCNQEAQMGHLYYWTTTITLHGKTWHLAVQIDIKANHFTSDHLLFNTKKCTYLLWRFDVMFSVYIGAQLNKVNLLSNPGKTKHMSSDLS